MTCIVFYCGLYLFQEQSKFLEQQKGMLFGRCINGHANFCMIGKVATNESFDNQCCIRCTKDCQKFNVKDINIIVVVIVAELWN